LEAVTVRLPANGADLMEDRKAKLIVGVVAVCVAAIIVGAFVIGMVDPMPGKDAKLAVEFSFLLVVGLAVLLAYFMIHRK
jgi:hypothetical protein